jgi:hypothetical protein
MSGMCLHVLSGRLPWRAVVNVPDPRVADPDGFSFQ